MSERPSQPNIPVVLCPKCGTSNPRDVAECIYCGAALLPADTSAAADLGPGRSCSIGCAAAVVAGVVSIAFYAAFLAISAAASLALASYAVHAFISTRKKESQVGPAAGRSASGRPTVDALTTVVTVLCCFSAINTIWLIVLAAYGVYGFPGSRLQGAVNAWAGWSLVPAILFLLTGLVIWVDIGRGVALRSSAIALAVSGFLGVISLLALPLEAKEVDSSRKIECLSHVKHLVTDISSYAEDHGGFPGENWPNQIAVPERGQLKCPGAPSLVCAYAENAALRGVKVDALSAAAATILVFETEKGPYAAGGPELLPKKPRHFGGDNFGFTDGHAAWVGRQALLSNQSQFRWKPE